ncbi:hypothetical protein Y886_09780 [Xanthomonas hyacinthi DSM 19077]|nr:hypothetical protein Y886_09780 [Xanthomonas hyacinthi DSM 19077]
MAIASNIGGKQALEGVVVQLSTPHPALAAFTSDGLVALACLGGRPALEAVKNGLPQAVALIRKMNNRVPERTARDVAELGKTLRVLSFFQCHSNPTHAFHEAMAEFEMSRQGLLQLFRCIGVTELEAISGTIPTTSQRWQRIVHALGMKPRSAYVQTPIQESLHVFADSLERELNAPSPMQDAFPAGSSSRKRSRSDDPVHSFLAQQIADAPIPEHRDAPHLPLLSSWGAKRPRSIAHGLPDPGMPTDAELAVSSAAFLEQDADFFPSPGAGEDFQMFSEEEIARLMNFFPDFPVAASSDTWIDEAASH